MQSSGSKPIENRRGSSIFAASASEQQDVSGPYGRPAYLYGQQEGSEALLVDFPEDGQNGMGDDMDIDDNSGHGGYGMNTGYASAQYQNGGYSFKNSGGGRRGSDLMSGAGHNVGKPQRLGEAARMQELADSQDLPGGPNHRPLVGGFAAAAYEAAKAHHYSLKRETPSGEVPRDCPPPPSI